MRVTVIAPFVPWPQIGHAGGAFLDDYLTALGARADVTLVAPATPANREAVDAARLPVDVHLVPLPPARSGVAGKARGVAAAMAGLSPGPGVLHAMTGDRTLQALVAAGDVAEIQFSWLLPLVPAVRRWAPEALVAAFEHDVHFAALNRRRRGATRAVERASASIGARVARAREPRLLNACDAVLTFSEADRGTLQAAGVGTPIRVVDPPLPPATDRAPLDNPVALFAGDVRRAENAEGLVWLLQRVWPAVVARVPEARLVVAGSGSGRLRSADLDASIDVRGWVDDLAALHRDARVFVAPNLTGAGVKFKVLHAMAYGLPVVATPIAAEGIADRLGSDAFASVTRDPSAMADVLVTCLVDPQHGVADRARRAVREKLDFERSVDAVLAVYAGACRDRVG